MDKFQMLVQNALGNQYSCIQDGDVVITPCYLIAPYGLGALKGNGICAEQTLRCEVCFFVETRKIATEIASQMQQVFLRNHYICTDPEMEYEKNAKAWKVIFLVEYVIERNET